MTGNTLHHIEQIESSLWETADQLRVSSKLTSSEYAMPVLGVIFLRHTAEPCMHLPSPPFTEEDKQQAAKIVDQHVWQQSVSGVFGEAA
jgi:hypothetical protein